MQCRWGLIEERNKRYKGETGMLRMEIERHKSWARAREKSVAHVSKCAQHAGQGRVGKGRAGQGKTGKKEKWHVKVHGARSLFRLSQSESGLQYVGSDVAELTRLGMDGYRERVGKKDEISCLKSNER
jgi:hypothetical protein